MLVVAVLLQEFRISGVEGQAVPAGLEGRHAALARVVLVAGRVVRVVTKLVGTLPVPAAPWRDGRLLGPYSDSREEAQVSEVHTHAHSQKHTHRNTDT